ncbi:hypothetical protein FF011L_24780 [Roseimaritima multifibrata]|uniref:Uncharacterized protein n=1 Tax=Roseimaritima multifibrata TaxID=1930274 RepID=A0A517MFN8_9BACT|nr:hypothetical protein FF011L_24780 [Roseimaritima multifibrata]
MYFINGNNAVNITVLQASVLTILIFIGCTPQKPVEALLDLQTISLESTKPYRTVRSIPLVSNEDKYEAGSEVLVVGEINASDLDKPVSIVRAEIRYLQQNGRWIIASSKTSANMKEGRYELTIKAPEKPRAYELHVNVLDQLYIGRCEFRVGPKRGG